MVGWVVCVWPDGLVCVAGWVRVCGRMGACVCVPVRLDGWCVCRMGGLLVCGRMGGVCVWPDGWCVCVWQDGCVCVCVCVCGRMGGVCVAEWVVCVRGRMV